MKVLRADLWILLLCLTCFRMWAQQDSCMVSTPIPRFSELMPMVDTDFPRLHIVHIGDSHLQSGFLGDAFRETLAIHYDLQGYGLISPYSLAGTNAPSSYRLRSSHQWNSCKLTYTRSFSPMSPSGMSIKRSSPVGAFTLSVSCPAYPFMELICYRGADSPSLIPTKGKYILKKGKIPQRGEEMIADTLLLSESSSELSLRSDNSSAKNAVYGGMILLRRTPVPLFSKPQALYSQIGINGAMYASYDRQPFVDAVARMNPHYLLLSLGSNESLARKFSKEAFKSQVQSFLRKCQRDLPEAKIILTTPAPNFRGNSFNRNTLLVRNTLLEIASCENLPVIDLFEAVGGAEGALELKRRGGYYAKDGIHFTKEAYNRQGRFMAEQLLTLIPLR